MTAAVLIGVVLVVFVVFGVVLSRRQSERKREAIADLQREKEALAPVSVLALAEEEADDLGLAQIRGAEGISPVVLLKVWKDNKWVVDRCPSRDQLRYTVADGVDPTMAAEPDVGLVCDGELEPAAGDDVESPGADEVTEDRSTVSPDTPDAPEGQS